jgi:Fe-S-cluster containining protein
MSDAGLIQIVDAALADAVRRSGDWLVCRAGCSQCCYGVFEITALDAARLGGGMEELERIDPERAARVRARVESARARLEPWFPGNLATGALTGTEEEIELFEEFAHADACPLLDPETQSCDVYEARPILCRTFGPPIRNEGAEEEGGLAICELNFVGATPEEIAAAEMDSGFRAREGELEEAFAREHPAAGRIEPPHQPVLLSPPVGTPKQWE